jgi:hypothetical protein
MDDEYRAIGVMERARFQRLQALEDAIAYRRARVTAPCRYCALAAPGRKCDDHARDLELIAEYQASARDQDGDRLKPGSRGILAPATRPRRISVSRSAAERLPSRWRDSAGRQ